MVDCEAASHGSRIFLKRASLLTAELSAAHFWAEGRFQLLWHCASASMSTEWWSRPIGAPPWSTSGPASSSRDNERQPPPPDPLAEFHQEYLGQDDAVRAERHDYPVPRFIWKVQGDEHLFTVDHGEERDVGFEGENITPRRHEPRDSYYSWPYARKKKIAIFGVWCCVCEAMREPHCMCPASVASMNEQLHEAVENRWGRKKTRQCKWPAKNICADCAVWKPGEDGHQYLKRLKKAFRFEGWTSVRVRGAVTREQWTAMNPLDARDIGYGAQMTMNFIEKLSNDIWAELWGYSSYEEFRFECPVMPKHELLERQDLVIPTTFLGYEPPRSRFDRPTP